MENINKTVTVITVVKDLVKNERISEFKNMVNSVHIQTYNNLKHLVIDGGSKDGSLDLLEQYKNKKWIEYYSQEDRGPYDAMNKAIKKCSSEYVIVLNSDDYFYDKYAVEIQMNVIMKKKLDYIYGNTLTINKNNIESQIGPAYQFDNTIFSQKGDNNYLFWLEMPFNHEGMVFRKECLINAGLFDFENYGIAADYALEMNLILNDFNYEYIPYNILCFRRGGISSDATFFHENVLLSFYKKFYTIINDINIDFVRIVRKKPTPYFLYCLNVYLSSLNLKHFNYSKFASFVKKIINSPKEKSISQTSYQLNFLFLHLFFFERKKMLFDLKIMGLPVLKLIPMQKDNRFELLLFGIVPLFSFKITERKIKIKLLNLIYIFSFIRNFVHVERMQ